jgi:GNAT superfamily N-acetyltransferase
MAQLRMHRAHLNDLPPVVMPAGYRLRTYQPGDEEAWAQIMNTGIGENHTVESTRADLIERPQFRPEGLFFVMTDAGEAVGSACAWRISSAGDETGYVHMVCVRPEHRGHHLGYWVTLAVLHYFRTGGMRDAILETDDFRLSALRIYLELGFVPVLRDDDPTQPERWQKLAPQLGITPPNA